MASVLAALMFPAILALLPLGLPIAFTVIGVAVSFAALGQLFGVFDVHLLSALPLRLIDLMNNDLLQAIPLFIYIGAILERTALARDLLRSLGALFGSRPGGLAVATLVLGILLAPTTGAIGATVVALGLLALPPMLSAGYDKRFACGLTAAVGTLGTVLPPSIVLVLVADQMRPTVFQAQQVIGFTGSTLFRTKDLFLGMVAPVSLAVAGYVAIVVWQAVRRPASIPPHPYPIAPGRAVLNVAPPLLIIVWTLFVIVTGRVYTVEAAGLAAIAFTLLALVRRELSLARLADITRLVMRIAGAMFLLIAGAQTFSLVFRGFGGDVLTRQLITNTFTSADVATPVVFAGIFVFGFFLDAIEIIFLVVPIAIPPLIVLGGDPVWLAVLVGVTLQTSFLLPPAGFALFFMDHVRRNIAAEGITMGTIYAGVRPFVAVQIVVLLLVLVWPALATWLPGHV